MTSCAAVSDVSHARDGVGGREGWSRSKPASASKAWTSNPKVERQRQATANVLAEGEKIRLPLPGSQRPK